jgi:hypothetical protein
MFRFLSLLLIPVLFSFNSLAFDGSSVLPEKAIRITIDERGYASIGRDTLTIIELTEEIHIRLWKSYLGTGKMPGVVLVSYKGNAASIHQTATEKALKEAQQKTLQEFCVHKYKKKFENVSSSQLKKMKKQFPILFQQVFTSPDN